MADIPPGSTTDLFYLVANLLPSDQLLATIPTNTTISKAIEFMERHGYSQVPVVTTVKQNVIGIFSCRSFTKGVLDLDGELEPNETFGEMAVGDFVESFRFVNKDDNWESIIRYLDRDGSVLVGSREFLDGIVTTIDVVNFLHQVAKPFVLIAEIELSIRRIISNCVNDEELHICAQNSLSDKYSPEEMPARVEDMTFNDYVQVIGDGRNWTHFDQFFGNARGQRRRTRNMLQQVGELRNDVFHFRRSLEDGDLRFIQNKRDLLQQKAIIFEGAQGQAENEAQVQ